MKREHILAVTKSSVIDVIGNNFNKLTKEININPLDVIISHREYLDNHNSIGDNRFLQGIGYGVVKHPTHGILAYRRKGTEGRLDGKISIGFGGHTSVSDIITIKGTEEIDFVESLNLGMTRELSEELTIDGDDVASALSKPKFIGCIVCDRTEVDKLHIGFVSEFNLYAKPENVSLGDHGSQIFWIKDVSEIDLNECEEWTKIILEQL